MSPDIFWVVTATAVAQSFFGVGVLLFGTPLLLLGHDFIQVFGVLLPVSLAINLLQVVRPHAVMDFALYGRILGYTLPPIALFLFLITRVRIDIGLVVEATFFGRIAPEPYRRIFAGFLAASGLALLR